MKRIAIIGNGAYGCALAYLLGKKHHITIFSREPKNISEYPLSDFGKLAQEFDMLCIAITTKGLSDLLPKIAPHIGKSCHIILAMKGFTAKGKLPVDEARQYFSQEQVSVLSGPGFAHEILDNIPVHLVLASTVVEMAFGDDFSLENLRLDYSRDIFGVSWCGVLKNIYAIGAGVASNKSQFDRKSYTDSVVVEMAEILATLGYERETAYGQAGIGDMWICTTPNSRNFRFGAGDFSLQEQAEGYNAAFPVSKLLESHLAQGRFPLIHDIFQFIISTGKQ